MDIIYVKIGEGKWKIWNTIDGKSSFPRKINFGAIKLRRFDNADFRRILEHVEFEGTNENNFVLDSDIQDYLERWGY